MIKIQEQEDIIDSLDQNMIVSASAGSGKTSVMVRKIINILKCKTDAHADIDQMLVLTFTNLAADELCSRLEGALLELAEVDCSWTEQIDLLKTSDISTIHAFCQKMLKKYYYETGLNPNFELLEDQKQIGLFTKSVHQALTCFKKNCPQDYLLLIEMFSSSRSDREIVDIVSDIHEKLSGVNSEGKWLDEVALWLYCDEGKSYAMNQLNQMLCDQFDWHKKALYNVAKNAKSLNKDLLAANILEFAFECEQIKIDDNFQSNVKKILEKTTHSQFRQKDKDDFDLQALGVRDDYKKFKDKVKKDLSELCFDQDVENQSVRAAKTIIDIYKKSVEIYAEEKSRNNVLDFSDLERKFGQLLQNKNICKQISGDYKYIFIDEFQDTNEVQKNIIDAFGGKVMAVGDVKQSIYGFRGSKPKIFVDMMDKYSCGDGGVTKKLNCNFRSNGEILHFVNLVFSKIMTQKTAGLDYANTSMLNPKANYPKLQSAPSVSVCVVNKHKSSSTGSRVFNGVYDMRSDVSNTVEDIDARNEARMVASKILQAKSSEIYDPSTASFRQTRFSDITILIKSRTKVDILCDELIASGVPVVASSKKMLCDFPEILIIIEMLKQLRNSKDDISLVAGLGSWFGKLSLDDLSQIRKYSNCTYFYECVERYRQECDDEISKKLADYFSFLQCLREVLCLGVGEVVDILINKSGYATSVSCQLGGMSKLSRLKCFENLVIGCEGWTLGELIDFLTDFNNGPKAPNFSSGDVDCVNITTIHASKGLEFPIVILFGCGQDLFSNVHSTKLKFNSDFGFAVNVLDGQTSSEKGSVQKMFLSTLSSREDFAEALRLLYVALTRAKNQLYITGVSDLDKLGEMTNASEYKIAKMRNFMSLILCSLPQDVLNKLCVKPDVVRVFDDIYNYQIELYDSVEERKEEQSAVTFSKANPLQTKQLEKYLTFNYIYNQNLKLSQKTTVSELAFDNDEYKSINIEPQNLYASEHNPNVSASDLGTLYHKVFENIDFSLAPNDMLAQVNKMLSVEEKQLVDADKIVKCATLVKNQIDPCAKMFKEKEFIMSINQKEIADDGVDEKVIVQGKIDLFCVGEKVTIFDYKLTSNKNELSIKNKYKKQLKLYSLALQKAINKGIDDIFIVDINKCRLIKL